MSLPSFGEGYFAHRSLSPRSECSQDLVQLLGEELGVVCVEGEGRPQPDGGVAATAAVHALLAQVGQDGVSPAVMIAS